MARSNGGSSLVVALHSTYLTSIWDIHMIRAKWNSYIGVRPTANLYTISIAK